VGGAGDGGVHGAAAALYLALPLGRGEADRGGDHRLGARGVGADEEVILAGPGSDGVLLAAEAEGEVGGLGADGVLAGGEGGDHRHDLDGPEEVLLVGAELEAATALGVGVGDPDV